MQKANQTQPLKVVSTSSDESEAAIRRYLADHQSGVLATADAVGNPHATVVFYTAEDDLSLTITTKQETQKCKNLRDNPSFALTIYSEGNQSALDISGHVQELYDEDKVQQAAKRMSKQSLATSGQKIPPVDKLVAGRYATFRLVPLVMRFARYGRSVPADSLFETLVLAA